jgi:hypothetical protein
MPLGLEVRPPDGTTRSAMLSPGVVSLVIDVVNHPNRTYAELSIHGADPHDTESYAWGSVRLPVGAESMVRIIDRQKGDQPVSVLKKEPVRTVAAGIEEAKQRTRAKIAELQAELDALEKWDPNVR